MRDFETLLVRSDTSVDGLLRVTLNRPEVLNALDSKMARDLLDLFRPLLLDTDGIRCIVITGAGEKAFSAGADLKERDGMETARWLSDHRILEQAIYAIMDCPVPTLAAVNGYAFGGGCELVMACDFAYAAEPAKFAMTEAQLGFMPGVGGTQVLPRIVGSRRAKEILMTCEPFKAREALEWGLVNQIVEADKLDEAVTATATRICSNAPVAIRQLKKAVRVAGDADLKTALAFEVEAYSVAVGSEDRREGVRAFNERRKPRFEGR